MGFPLPDLIIESILRDGFENARRDPEVVEDVFAPLTRPYAEKKYGISEIEKIQKVIENREVSIVHSFHAVDSKIPCISIQMAEDTEKVEEAYLSDFTKLSDVPFSTPDKIAGTIKISNITPISYDAKSGVLKLPDSINLASIHVNLLYVDASQNAFPILGGINNTNGQKQIVLDKNLTVDLGAGGEIRSSIDFDRYNNNQTAEQTTVILGIHTQEPLLTKYLYTLIKYFLLSRKKDICSRGILLSTYSGSDFTRNMDYASDQVYTRFLHIHGIIHPTWRADKVQLIDNIEVNIKIPRDKYGNETLGRLEDPVQTIQTTEDDDA
jgi:hypothetical protein